MKIKTKNEIRNINKIKRREMKRDQVTEKSNRAARVFIESDLYKNAEQIMLYKPLGNETDTECIINTAFKDGKKVVFPVTNPKTGDIIPYYATRKTEFIKGAFSVAEPCGEEIADISKIDVVIVPGIAFDKNGTRIGFGKGCYDRFLKNTTAVLVGYCYEFQISDNIPMEKHDVKMNFLITEKGYISCGEI